MGLREQMMNDLKPKPIIKKPEVKKGELIEADAIEPPVRHKAKKGKARKDIYNYVSGLLGRDITKEEHDELKRLIFIHDELLAYDLEKLRAEMKGVVKNNIKYKKQLNKFGLYIKKPKSI